MPKMFIRMTVLTVFFQSNTSQDSYLYQPLLVFFKVHYKFYATGIDDDVGLRVLGCRIGIMNNYILIGVASTHKGVN